jgi:hypothetical protein
MANKSFELIEDDLQAFRRIIAYLAKTQGPVSYIVALRFALRKAVKGLPK